jgi:hypothetical protein
MFWFTLKKFSGSYCAFTTARRSCFPGMSHGVVNFASGIIRRILARYDRSAGPAPELVHCFGAQHGTTLPSAAFGKRSENCVPKRSAQKIMLWAGRGGSDAVGEGGFGPGLHPSPARQALRVVPAIAAPPPAGPEMPLVSCQRPKTQLQAYATGAVMHFSVILHFQSRTPSFSVPMGVSRPETYVANAEARTRRLA